MSKRPHWDWLLLTKRPENMLRFAPWKGEWPLNVWAMASVENQEMAENRLPHLLKVPAIVRALSVEPLLDYVDLTPWLSRVDWVIVGGESGSGARAMHPGWVTKIQKDCAQTKTAFFFKQWGQWSPVIPITDLAIPVDKFMASVGKGNSGRVLNGHTWNEFPSTRAKSSFKKQNTAKNTLLQLGY